MRGREGWERGEENGKRGEGVEGNGGGREKIGWKGIRWSGMKRGRVILLTCVLIQIVHVKIYTLYSD